MRSLGHDCTSTTFIKIYSISAGNDRQHRVSQEGGRWESAATQQQWNIKIIHDGNDTHKKITKSEKARRLPVIYVFLRFAYSTTFYSSSSSRPHTLVA
jgi:hypothetical protein